MSGGIFLLTGRRLVGYVSGGCRSATSVRRPSPIGQGFCLAGVKLLEAHDMQSQVPELLHQPPELRVVPDHRDDAGVAALGRLDLDVIDETDQQPPAFAPDDDPVLSGVARGFDHGKSRCRYPEEAGIRGMSQPRSAAGSSTADSIVAQASICA